MNHKKLFSNLVTLLFLGIFIWYGVHNKDSFEALRSVSVIGLFLVVTGKLGTFTANGLFTKWSAEAFTKKFSLGDGIYISILSAIGNFFGPLLGGTSIRAVYLKKYHSLPYSKFTSTLMWYYLILFSFVSLVAIISLLFLTKTDQVDTLLVFFGWALAILLVVSFFRLPNFIKNSSIKKNIIGKKIIKVLSNIEDGWVVILRDKKLLMKLLIVSVLSFVANYFVSFIEFRSLGIDISLPALGLYSTLVTASLLVSFTPGAIGIRETMLLLVSSTIGISNDQVLQVAVIDRGVHFFLLLLLFLMTRNSKLKQSLTTKEVAI